MKHVALFFLLFVPAQFLLAFTSLSDAQRYAARVPEYPSLDDEKYLLIPQYTHFHRKHDPSLIYQWVQSLGLFCSEWSISEFKKLLTEIVHSRKSLIGNGHMVQKITPKPGSRFFIFGDLHAAFHSLVRDLTFLQQQGVIADDFTLLDEDCYIVFNGNCIDQSPYNLEALSLLIKLLLKNPKNVIYVAGSHESDGAWFDFDLKVELQTRIFSYHPGDIPLSNELITFFKSLPRALYLVGKTIDDEDNFIRISHSGQGDRELNNEYIKNFLLNSANEVSNTLETGYIESSEADIEKKVNFEAIIKSENRAISYTPTQGLVQLIPDEGVLAWNIFSSPVLPHQKMYNFFYDAYALLSITELLANWTITLYNQDVRFMLGFKENEEYYVASGIKTSSITADRMQEIYNNPAIRLGSSMDLSRSLRNQAEQLHSGLFLRFDKQNWEGGIFDKLINLEILDDKYLPYRSRSNMETFIKEGIKIIVNPIGSPTVAASLDLIKTGSLLVLFPITGAPVLRHSDIENIVHFRPSYAAEGYALVQYAIEQLGVSYLAFFYQDDAYGIGALQGARKALEDFGITRSLEVPYARTEVSFTRQVNAIKDNNPDAILFFATTPASQQLILQTGIQTLVSKYLLGLSDWGENVFINFMKQKGLSYIIVNVVPNPHNSDLEIVKIFRKRAEESRIMLDTFSLEGFINASLVIDLIRRADGSLELKDILAQARAIKNEDYYGLEIDFNDKTHELSRKVWIDAGKPQWEEQVVKEFDLDSLSATL